MKGVASILDQRECLKYNQQENQQDFVQFCHFARPKEEQDKEEEEEEDNDTILFGCALFWGTPKQKNQNCQEPM